MDAVLESAVDLARAAAVEVADDTAPVGDHLGAAKDGERLVTHLFACTLPGYHGWVWSVTLARAPRAREATVCEAHLIPSDDALLAPSWVPWAERVRPGDLEPSMVMPIIHEDPRLMPGYEAVGDDEIDELAIWELGLGRERVLAPRGRDSAAQRWERGSHGPTAASAIASSAPCSTCAFFIPLTGAMRTTFGACANEWSPSDGKVVAVDHGCGAHSQTDIEKQASRWPDTDPLIDTDASVQLDLTTPDPEPEPESAPKPDEEQATDDAPAEQATGAPDGGSPEQATAASADAPAEPVTDAPAEAAAHEAAENGPPATPDESRAPTDAAPEATDEATDATEPPVARRLVPEATEPTTASAPEPGVQPGDAEGDPEGDR